MCMCVCVCKMGKGYGVRRVPLENQMIPTYFSITFLIIHLENHVNWADAGTQWTKLLPVTPACHSGGLAQVLVNQFWPFSLVAQLMNFGLVHHVGDPDGVSSSWLHRCIAP